MHPIVVTGSQSGMGAAIAGRLRGTGQTVIGVDLPGHGAEIEGRTTPICGPARRSSSWPARPATITGRSLPTCRP